VCLAYPGKIISIKGDRAAVDYGGIIKEANVSLTKVKVGDFVIVHAGFAIQKLTDEEAWDAIKFYEQNEG